MMFTPEDQEQNAPEREMRTAREKGVAADDRWHVCKDGSRIWVNGLMNAIHDEQGNFLGFSKVVRDETKKQEMQAALNRTAMENERILTAITDAVYKLDAQWRFTYINPQAERMLNRSKADMLGKNIWEAMPEKLDTAFNPEFHRAMGERVPVHFVGVYPPLDKLFDVRAYPSDDGGMLAFFVDVTQRERLETERRKLELERLLASQLEEERRRIGRELHDNLRQQLTGLRMLAGSLYTRLRERVPNEARMVQEFADLLADANMQVRELISGLLPPKVTASFLPAALDREGRGLERWYGISCEVTAPTRIPLKDDAVANHLFYILREAMTNAGKHSKANCVNVSVRVTEEDLVFQVHDDGVGLPPDFEARGSMGISNMRHRAELINAELTINSQSHEGTTVTCILPKPKEHAHDGAAPA
jgi:signal transduction histidine kinase